EAIRIRDLAPDVEDLSRQRDVDRANGLTGIAADAERLGSSVRLEPVVERRVDEADGARVDVSENVAADHLVRRTDAGAGGAANAAQSVDEIGIVTHRRAAVVDEDVVQLALGPVGTGNEGDIGRDRLP